MMYIFDNDLHIHSGLSFCSNDHEQNPERILQYAKDNGVKTLCLTDHFWDETVPGASEWYKAQNFEHISAAKPLPQADGIRFLFGCETDMDKYMTVGLSKENFDKFDFVVIPTTHMHMKGFTISQEDFTFEGKTRLWYERFEKLLEMDLPFHKIGIAHLTCPLVTGNDLDYVSFFDGLDGNRLGELFTKAAGCGCGIELNMSDFSFRCSEPETVLRIYRIAKECGCKFYCATDAHHPGSFAMAKDIFNRAIDLLELSENDKFLI